MKAQSELSPGQKLASESLVTRPPEVEFHPEAVEEAAAAREWYAERSPIAASRFADELDDAIRHVVDAPEAWPASESGTRRYLFRRFPFALIYRPRAAGNQVLAVAHCKRRPGYGAPGSREVAWASCPSNQLALQSDQPLRPAHRHRLVKGIACRERGRHCPGWTRGEPVPSINSCAAHKVCG